MSATRIAAAPDPGVREAEVELEKRITFERALRACVDLAKRMDNRPAVCPHCLGTGHPLPSTSWAER